MPVLEEPGFWDVGEPIGFTGFRNAAAASAELVREIAAALVAALGAGAGGLDGGVVADEFGCFVAEADAVLWGGGAAAVLVRVEDGCVWEVVLVVPVAAGLDAELAAVLIWDAGAGLEPDEDEDGAACVTPEVGGAAAGAAAVPARAPAVPLEAAVFEAAPVGAEVPVAGMVLTVALPPAVALVAGAEAFA